MEISKGYFTYLTWKMIYHYGCCRIKILQVCSFLVLFDFNNQDVKPKTWKSLVEVKNKFNEYCLFELQRELSDAMKQKIRAEYQAVGGSPDKPLSSNYFLNIIIAIGVLAILTYLVGNWYSGIFKVNILCFLNIPNMCFFSSHSLSSLSLQVL